MDDASAARAADVSLEAVQLVRDAETIDLHLESFIPTRLWGYDLNREHRNHWTGGHRFGHLDFPRALGGGLTGAMWSICTNPARFRESRYRTLLDNARVLRSAVESNSSMRVVRTYREWQEARASGLHGAMISVQGGNAYEAADDPREPSDVVRVTVMHFTDSCFGATSAPRLGRSGGLTVRGRAFVEQLDAARIFVDLAHISRAGFWDAVDAHDPALPLIVTHTGVDGVRPMWRNIDDDQVRAVADSGGVIGIIFAGIFLRRRGGPDDGRMVLEHMEHAIKVGGEAVVAIGSDYDGFITPPKDLRDGAIGYYRLVQYMLNAKWEEDRIRRILGRNYLASFRALRP